MLSNPYFIAGLVVVALWVLVHFKTSRSDGTLIGKVHPYRRMMPFIMPTRNESVVYFDDCIRAEPLLEYLEEARGEFEANMTHCIVAACNIGVAYNPAMNRYIVGKRMYQRNARWFTFAAKRKKKDAKSRLGVVKMEIGDGETFRQLVTRINDKIGHERSGKKTSMDKELSFFLLIPRSVLAFLVSVFKYVDYLNLLPAFFIRDDGMYTTVFIANLGSVGMAPGYHHLYEWGTAPLFIMMGKIEDRAVVEDGKVVVGKVLPLRFSYDERIDDGLTASRGINAVHAVLADPRRWLGGLTSDGTADLALYPRTGEDADGPGAK